MAKPLDTTRFIAEVLAGQHDEQLGELLEAVASRIKSEQLRSRWRMSYEGLEVTEDDLTLDECAQIEHVCRVPWTNFNPQTTANQAMALLQVALRSRKGMSEAEAADRVKTITAIQAADLFDIYIAESSPLDNPDPS